YEALRTSDPVHRLDDYTVVLTRHDDVLRTLRGGEFARDIEQHAAAPIDNPVMQRRRERSEQRSKSILNLDPPDHTRLRKLVTQAFTPKAVDRLRHTTEQMVDDVLDRAESKGGMEVIDELAFPVPFQVISSMLDMPTERADDLRDWSQILTATLEPTTTLEDLDRADVAVNQLIPYLFEIIEERRLNLGDDVVSALLMSFVVLLYVAGHETTVNLIGNGLLALLEHPDQLERWRNDPTLDATAVDELLRFNGPVQNTVRVPLQPVTYAGIDGEPIVVDPGSIVTTCLGAANRDPALFDSPNALRLDRPNAQRHLAFASGIHYCLGASLARMEATVALTRLIRRFDNISLIGEPTWRDRYTIRGVNHLEIEFG
ncbi:MAG: cytochrome P450, partial [Actinobacteria bacterium]|nr:cytochrome P450 [Actinomycetota bacterium]